MTRTSTDIDAKLTQPRSGPVRYEVVNNMGIVSPMKFDTAQAAVAQAMKWFPDQQHDEDRSGKGWDVQVVQS